MLLEAAVTAHQLHWKAYVCSHCSLGIRYRAALFGPVSRQVWDWLCQVAVDSIGLSLESLALGVVHCLWKGIKIFIPNNSRCWTEKALILRSKNGSTCSVYGAIRATSCVSSIFRSCCVCSAKITSDSNAELSLLQTKWLRIFGVTYYYV